MLDVRPFTFEQVQLFVHNWYRANEVMSSQKDDPGVQIRAKAGAQDLIRRIQQTPALASMAVNPLLLTMIATIHRYRNTLPGKRVELYAEICDVFLGKRQQARDIKVDLSPAQCASVLQPLAYEMMIREQREIPALAAQQIIQKPLELVHESMTPETFLQMVENISGLLLERDHGTYYFAHQTFQEYLAATYIHDQRQEAVLIAHLGESWWAETIRLYCAQTDATCVIEACLNHSVPSIPHLTLAFECQEEALKVQPTIKPQLDRALEQGAENADLQRKKVVAETLLRRRLKEMVPVQEGIYRDTSLILCAEYQLFLDEQYAAGNYYQPDHWSSSRFPQGQALLPITGMRPSAAQAFCDWLTEWEQGIWHYRLPKPGEYQQENIHIRPVWLPPSTWNIPFHGYWQEKDFPFQWIRKPVTTRTRVSSTQWTELDLDLRLMDATSIGQVKITEGDYFLNYINLARARALDLDLDRDLGLDHERATARARDLGLALARARASAHAQDRAHALAYTLARDLAHALDLARALALSRALAQDLALARSRAHAQDRTLSRALARALINISTLIFDYDDAQEHRASHIIDLAELLVLLSICVSFSTYELSTLTSYNPIQPLWKRIFAFRKKNNPSSLEELQKILNRGVEVHRRLERLKMRRQGKENVCECLLIIKERKKSVPGVV